MTMPTASEIFASSPARQGGVRRGLDLLCAGMAACVLSPVFVIVAFAIWIESGRPILFSQLRLGQNGRPFRIYKFRKFRPNCDLNGYPLTMKGDDRLTAIGRILAATKLDELPQLWNVIAGEMSLVGPRPLPADQVAANLDLLRPRHTVPAGVTGWWQINGRSRLTPEEALQLDLFYIENWSPTLDLYILLKTFSAVIGRQGAY